jgi:Tol biopolymer transport system component
MAELEPLKRAALLAVALIAGGCGSVEKAGGPAPVERHLVYEKVAGERGIWIADVDGSNPRLFVPDAQGPVISPDGKWVVYGALCSEPGASDCDNTYVVSTELGAKPRLLAEQAFWPTTWSPDSKAIVAEHSLDVSRDALVRVDVASGKEVTLARGEFRGWSIAPDGKQIVFALAHGDDPRSLTGERIDLYVANLDGRGEPNPITDTGDAGHPVWGPKSIAYAKLIPYKGYGRNEIWRIQPDGSGRTTITGPLPGRFLTPPAAHCVGLEPSAWSQDGAALLARWECEALGEAVAVDPQTGAIRSLGEGTFTVALSRDGQFALVQWGDERAGSDQRVLIYPYAGGKPTIVARGAFGPSWNR